MAAMTAPAAVAAPLAAVAPAPNARAWLRTAPYGVPAASARQQALLRRGTVMVAAAAAPSAGGIEAVSGVRPEVDAAIAAALDRCVTESDLGMGKKYTGKVRDTYDLGDKLVIVTTDRQSAFDRLLAAIPCKGQVLNQTSAWWMHHTQHIVGNALLSMPDPNACIMKKCEVFPVEFVCRGFMTGSTDTSLWTHYKAGEREYCGNTFPDGMRKNDRLAQNVITPTTKAVDHDVPISPADIVAQGLMSQADWDAVSAAALALFAFGQDQAARRGLLLVDTKYEFGKDTEGNILLIDEIHTPDSSRYWIADTYEQRHGEGGEPQNIDKEFLRLWFRANCDPYNDPVLPEAPAELRSELGRRYVLLYEKITGQAFQPASLAEEPAARMRRNVTAALEAL
ncbi:Phosphoribosylaminoimidazole-succinocarboxam ide chloroplastic [Micractinium conductrix]|uniref:Phosphoribosylaminoimidazole-succinocarboxamide synthase, chloroplastic n=1 Tax=Micractinium conductrix TaxID=554055 RepID=A0A2P6VQH2_9CHLO|nr:Phosphoribosylaminoimidazole-succinocarboxam ide chloroplastic [Micractinium conductrix]|eukprot:PSC76321.1 Phosphoribosylaminoimidazole-succinocarboxam ide chloroplastic [Micractinium conductrix]